MPRFREGIYSRVQRLVETKLAGAGHKAAGETVYRVFKRVQGYSIVEIHQNHSHIVDWKCLPWVRVTPIVIAQIGGSDTPGRKCLCFFRNYYSSMGQCVFAIVVLRDFLRFIFVCKMRIRID